MGKDRHSRNIMPRKKLDSPTPTLETPETEPAKTATRRTRAKTPEPTPAPVVEEPKTKSRARTAKPKAEPVADKEKAPRRAKAKSAVEPEKPELEYFGDVAVLFRSRAVGRVAASPSAEEAPVAAEPEQQYTWEADELPVPIWRPLKSNGRPAAVAEDAPNLAPRRSRRRRRKDQPEHDSVPARASIEEDFIEHEQPAARPQAQRGRAIPEPPSKPPIPIPDEAPQVVLREGIPTIVRDHRVYPPILFFGSPSDERRAETVLDELKMAVEAGVHIHSFLVDLDVEASAVDASVAFASYMLAQTVGADPESQVVFRIAFVAPRNWEDRYPDAKYVTSLGELAEPSVCDNRYWATATECLEKLVRQLRALPLRDHILGIHLERGEWFYTESQGYDTSRAALHGFRDWARTRYSGDEVTLRASWFDGDIRFDTIQIPPFEPEGAEGEKFVRSSRKQRRTVDYHLFLSDATVQRISDLAYSIKAASEGYFLVGCSYGYTFEWSHPSSGHLALGKLLRCQEVDFIAGPPSYRNREPGGTAPFPCPIDSFALNGKLYLSEEDFKTSLSVGHEPDDFNPIIRTPQALESVHWRGVGAALAHASGVEWMDLWGNGWLKTAGVWDRAGKVRDALIERMDSPLTAPEVAIFIDERALAYLVDSNAFSLLVQNVRESVLRAGVSAGFYLLSDLAHREKFPESKLYVFLNAWDIRPELRAAIKSRLQRDNKVLFWLYAAGLFDAGRDSLERAREVTGIALKPQPFYSKAGTTILNRRHPLSEAFPDRSLIGGTKLEPSYFAIPENATVLGEYSQTGLPSFVVREFREGPAETHWTSVFLGEPLVNPALIRALAVMAGAHVWNYQEDVTHVRQPFLTVHCSGAGPRAIALPSKFSAFNILTNTWAAVDSTNLRFTAVDGSSHMFMVGPKDELSHFLNRDTSGSLRLESLPPRELNVLQDNANFDVPIMRLDEWIGSADSDEVADEWFLRPPQIDDLDQPEASDSQERIGRRRRRRRGRGHDRERGGSEESASARPEPSGTPSAEFEELGMNVMFRKRDS